MACEPKGSQALVDLEPGTASPGSLATLVLGQEAPSNPAALDTTAVAGEADAQPPATKARGPAKYNQFDLRRVS